jgi:hypothetical protein
MPQRVSVIKAAHLFTHVYTGLKKGCIEGHSSCAYGAIVLASGGRAPSKVVLALVQCHMTSSLGLPYITNTFNEVRYLGNDHSDQGTASRCMCLFGIGWHCNVPYGTGLLAFNSGLLQKRSSRRVGGGQCALQQLSWFVPAMSRELAVLLT